MDTAYGSLYRLPAVLPLCEKGIAIPLSKSSGVAIACGHLGSMGVTPVLPVRALCCPLP